MEKVTLIVDIIVQEVYRDNVVEIMPSLDAVKVSKSYDFLEGVNKEDIQCELLNIVNFSRINSYGDTDKMYIAMNHRVERLLKFPFNYLVETNRSLQHQVDYQLTIVQKYQKLSFSWWERLKFIFTNKVVI